MRRVQVITSLILVGGALQLTALSGVAHAQQTTAVVGSAPQVEVTTPDKAQRRAEISKKIDALTGHEQAPTIQRERVSAFQRPDAPSYGTLLGKMILGLGAVILLAWAMLKFGLRRFFPQQTTNKGVIKVLARQGIEPKRSVMVLRVGQRHLVVASSEAGVQPLCELSAEEALDFVDSPEVIPKAFSLEVESRE